MLFNSISFLVFFPIILLVYYFIPIKLRLIWLLIISYYFYMCWNLKYGILIFGTTIVTYLCGLGIERFIKYKNIFLLLCLTYNLGVLALFKYFDSFVMPVGISFYTFVGIGYVIDVYRKEIRAERNILKYGLFVSFFPQLVSGPIERSNNLLLQIQEGRERQRLEYQKIIEGLILMLWGYFQKIVIADRAAVLVNTVYAGYEEYQMVPLATAAIVYGLQIYCDFSGYSTIAIGAAKVLGFDLIENFNTPYFAKSIVDFWHRWHLSLTSWFTDYVYIPLGGNRCSKGKKYCNILLTFGVSGIWHGANLTFVIWGILHGLFQIIEKELSPIINRINKFFHTRTESFGYHFFQVITTFILVNIAWIFFERKLCEMLFIT